jgi:DNA-binding SARP family transcriptional activator
VLGVLLLRRNELVPTATLVDEIWGDRPPASIAKIVQGHVWRLRRALEESAIETRPLGYLLRVEQGALDSDRFEELLDRGRTRLEEGAALEAAVTLREALGLWRGPPLADFAYEPFARNEIGRLADLRLVALEQRLEADLALGRHAEVVPELEAFVREHPLRETLRRLLMLALYRSGRQADALAVYQDARATLVEELGLDPGQALQRLEQQILRQDPALDPVAPPPPPPLPIAPEPAPAAPAAAARKVVTVVCVGFEGEEVDPERRQLARFRLVESTAVAVKAHKDPDRPRPSRTSSAAGSSARRCAITSRRGWCSTRSGSPWRIRITDRQSTTLVYDACVGQSGTDLSMGSIVDVWTLHSPRASSPRSRRATVP